MGYQGQIYYAKTTVSKIKKSIYQNCFLFIHLWKANINSKNTTSSFQIQKIIFEFVVGTQLKIKLRKKSLI